MDPRDDLCINTIRTLSIDAIQKANSGHPGAVMALAPFAYTLWQEFLRYDPAQPRWPNRDRFVLSAGHASMLIYSLLHLAEVQAVDPDGRPTGEPSLDLDQITRFRQIDSATPGHPESHLTSGVEVTTGPLGQGVATSVGLAIAGLWQAARYNQGGEGGGEGAAAIFDYDVYAICSDGDFMEGVSAEAASLAGHQGLSNLCWIYDNNHISIDGDTELAYSDDVRRRFEGYGWKVLEVGDANDVAAARGALDGFRAERHAPTLIIVDSHIGYGAPNKQDTASAHGEPLGDEETRLAKRAYGWPEDSEFLVPDGVYERFREGIGARGAQLRAEWESARAAYAESYPELAAELDAIDAGRLPEGWDATIPSFDEVEGELATRKASAKVLGAIAEQVPWLVVGSADLTDSTSVRLPAECGGNFDRDNRAGRQLHFGVREHESAATSNGLALCGLRPAWSSYLTFSDYARPAIRLSALMELPVTHIFTHDSIGLGEDGPTHQPIEQLAALRAMPGLSVIRPADAHEVAEAWRVILPRTEGPSLLVLTRQNVPVIDRKRYNPAEGLRRGAYVIADSGGAAGDGSGGAGDGELQVILLATGSEVALAIEAHERLTGEGVRSRVVSMPSWDLFEAQGRAYRDAVLPPSVTARVSVEQAATFGWDRYVGPDGAMIGMTRFGASGKFKEVEAHFGFTADHVTEVARSLLYSAA